MSIKSLGTILIMTFALVFSVYAAEKGSLDGKTFVVDMKEKGKEKADKDTLHFMNGTLHSVGCDQYGFKAAPYKTTADGDSMMFESEAASEKEGLNQWKGTVKGDMIEGTLLWTKKGQAPVTYTFAGQIKK